MEFVGSFITLIWQKRKNKTFYEEYLKKKNSNVKNLDDLISESIRISLAAQTAVSTLLI